MTERMEIRGSTIITPEKEDDLSIHKNVTRSDGVVLEREDGSTFIQLPPEPAYRLSIDDIGAWAIRGYSSEKPRVGGSKV